MYKWVIFDMDWLLIDSEPLWQKAEIKVFEKLWINIQPIETMWFKVEEVVEYWYNKNPWDTIKIPKKKIEQDIEINMSECILKEWLELEWIHYIMKFFKERWFKISINSSSSYKLINSVIKKFRLWRYIDFIHSWEDEEYWKPHPAWYINTCMKMWLRPFECLAFEDSVTGVLSVKSAKITCICIPCKDDFNNLKFSIADIKLHSLLNFTEDILKKL